MATPYTDDSGEEICPVCEAAYTRVVRTKFGGSIDHTADLTQARTCFWPFEHPDGPAAVAVFYHVDTDPDPDDETIQLDDD